MVVILKKSKDGSTCKKLMDKLNGRVLVYAGGGSTFHVQIPEYRRPFSKYDFAYSRPIITCPHGFLLNGAKRNVFFHIFF